MYKFSEFNKIIKSGKDTVLFNKISGKIIKIESDVLKKDLEIGVVSEDIIDLMDELVQDNFIVSDTINEKLIVQYKMNEIIYNRVLELIIVPTTSCNFRCEYCYQNFQDKNMSNEIQNGIINYVKRNINGFIGLRVNWYGGEPLLSKNIINHISNKLLKICKEVGKPYLSTITTNGYLLTEDVFIEMLKNNIVTYVITIDGTEKYHDRYRHLKNGEGTFKKIINNLICIRDRVPKKLFSILIRINVTIDSLNNNLAELINYLDGEFGNDSRFEFLVYPVSDWGGSSIHKMKGSLINSYDQIFEFLISNKVKLNFNPYYKYLKLTSCWAAKRYSYLIDPNGLVKKCTMQVDREEYNIGKILEVGKMEFNEAMLAKWIVPEKYSDNMCQECERKIECISFCPLIKNFIVSDFDCEFKFFNVEKIIELLIHCDKYVNLKKI